MRTVPIAFAFDNNFIMPACVCISSLLMNANEDTFYDIFILHSQTEKLDEEKLNSLSCYYPNCRIQYRTIDNTFDDAFEIRGITTSTYYRLLIPEIITEYDKIIYSDVDVIFRSDLSDTYFNTDMTNSYVAGVNALVQFIPDLKKYYSKLGSVNIGNVIYAGNIIFNSANIRKDNLVARFKELAKNNYKFQDLDVLNIACQGKITYMGPDFCLTTYVAELSIYDRNKLQSVWSRDEINKALKTGIVHYNGQKPWKGYCVNFDIWWEYYRKSPFFDEKYYFDFFYSRLNELDQLSLWKRIKILVRYFVYGKSVI